MEFQRQLKQFKLAIDKELARHFDKMIRDAQKKDPLIAEALMQTKKIALAGGKRLRGALVYFGYLGAGGRQKNKIIRVAVAIELVHLFLLIHDDVIDRGFLRHGEKTLNEYFSGKKFGAIDAKHFGDSMAIIIGDMLYALAIELIIDSGFEPTVTAQALKKLQHIAQTTIIGQSQDISLERNKKVTQCEVLTMYENKTARYTFEGPLHLGLMFAQCTDKKTLQQITKYALPLGIAFQIQDDMLGIFGSEKKMGKGLASDIEEGKQSLMVVHAKKNGTKKQREIITSLLGRKNLSSKQIREFQNVLKSTGSVTYAEEMVEDLLKKGRQAAQQIILLPQSKQFLIGIVDYLEKREV